MGTHQKKPGSPIAPLLTLKVVHDKPITALAFAPDGETLVSGSDKTVRLWDATSGDACACGVMNDAPWGIAETVFSPDGRTVAAVSKGVNKPHKDETRAFLWDLIKRKSIPLHPLQAGNDNLRSPAFGPGSNVALLGDGIRFFDAAGNETGSLTQAGMGHRMGHRMGHHIALSPDGVWAVFGHKKGSLYVLDIEKQFESQQLKEHTDYITALVFSPDGRWLASASSFFHGSQRYPEDWSIRIWDFKKKKQLRVWANGWDTTPYLTFLADNRHLISFHDPDGNAHVILWSVEAEKPLADWPVPGVTAVAVWSASTGKHTSGLIATGYRDGRIKIWDIATVLPAPGIDRFEPKKTPSEPTQTKTPSTPTKKAGRKAKPTQEDDEDYFSQ